MRVDVRATKRMWRQTVWGTAIAWIGVVAVMVYLRMLPNPDKVATRFLLLLLIVMPLVLGVAYVIRRFIEGLTADR